MKEARTAIGWIATARNFMINDKKSGKLILKKECEKSDDLYLDYLKFTNGTS
jgi:hypothetical protein